VSKILANEEKELIKTWFFCYTANLEKNNLESFMLSIFNPQLF